MNSIQDMANATVRDQEAIQKLQVSNEELKNIVCQLNTQVSCLQTPAPVLAPAPPTTPTLNPRTRRCRRLPPPNSNYCWIHGFQVHENHKSSNCRTPAPGHVNTATADNTQGGSRKNIVVI